MFTSIIITPQCIITYFIFQRVVRLHCDFIWFLELVVTSSSSGRHSIISEEATSKAFWCKMKTANKTWLRKIPVFQLQYYQPLFQQATIPYWQSVKKNSKINKKHFVSDFKNVGYDLRHFLLIFVKQGICV